VKWVVGAAVEGTGSGQRGVEGRAEGTPESGRKLGGRLLGAASCEVREAKDTWAQPACIKAKRRRSVESGEPTLEARARARDGSWGRWGSTTGEARDMEPQGPPWVAEPREAESAGWAGDDVRPQHPR
jgi:hypothetical protein